MNVANAINASLYAGANYTDDIVPVVNIASAPFVVAVLPSSASKTIPELIAAAKASPGKLNMGSSGSGTPPYLSGTMFKQMAGIDIVQVPHRNSLHAINELLAGRIDLIVSDMAAAEFVHSGQLHALAVTTASRQNALPGVPSLAEFLPGYDAMTWYGLGVPSVPPRQSSSSSMQPPMRYSAIPPNRRV